MHASRNQPVKSFDDQERLTRNVRHSLRLIPRISATPWIRLPAIVLLFVFIVVPAIAGDVDYWAPWVTKLSTTSAAINWHGADAGLGSLEYATSSYYEENKSFQKKIESEKTGAYQHVALADLEPDTSYVYKVKPSDNPDAFTNRTFRTMPVSGPFTFLVISDSHAQEKRFKPVADAIAKYETDALFILDGGDFTSFDYEPYWSVYFQYADKMLGKFPIFNTIGNHEYHNHENTDAPPTDAYQYHETFDIPKGGALNYSFDCSGIRFVVLNSPDPQNANDENPTLALAKSQAAWLKKQLDNTMAGTFTIHHHPIWTYGRTGLNPNLQPWETLYHKYNISANFAGHMHSYQRLSVKGIPYFVIGNAGGKFINMTPDGARPKWYLVGETRQLGYLKVSVDPEHGTATAQEIFVAYVETNDSEDPIVYDTPIIADTVTFSLKSKFSTFPKKAVGWAVGGVSGGYGTILHTTDGGQTWVRQGVQDDIANVALSGVMAVDEREAWVVGESVILHTRDGGKMWSREADDQALTGAGLSAVSAVDIYTAWAVGAGGVILRTTNGGSSWERQGGGQIPAVDLSGVYAGDAYHVWVVGGPEEGNNYGTILHTTDGGGTWDKVPYTVTHNPSLISPYLITVHGANANDVWAVGRDQIMHISVTRKGITVTDQTPKFSDFMDVNGVFALNSHTVWTVGDSSNIWHTNNGGKAWILRNKGNYDHGYIFRVSAIDRLNAWATEGDQAGKGQILYTSNGGGSWTPQTIPVAPQMWGISFVGKQK